MNNDFERGSEGFVYQKRFGLFHGTETFFDLDRDTTLRVWLSNWTGKEVITLNNKILSSQYAIRFKSEHCFVHNDQDYRVIVQLKMGHLRIELWRDDQLMDFDLVSNGRVLSRGDGSKSVSSKQIVISMLSGAGLGALGMLLGYWAARVLGG